MKMVKVVDVVKKLRKLSKQDNYFLNGFLQTVEAIDPNSKDGLNKVVSNTFARLSDNQKVKIQNGFAALYGDALTRPDAIKLLHYIIIKDGLQFNTGSIMEALSPFVLEHFLDKTQDGIEVTEELKNEFIDGYFQSPTSQGYLTTILPKDVSDNKQIIDKKETYSFDPEQAFETGVTGQKYIMIGNGLFKKQPITSNNIDYARVEFMGSVGQNGIGFMFNTPGFQRPSTRSIQNKQDNKSSRNLKDALADQTELNALDKLNFDPGVDITADEKSIMIGKQKISNLVKERTEAVEVPEEQADQFDSVEGEVLPETTSKIKDLLKSKTGINQQVLGDFWNSEINNNQERKQKLGYDTYGNMLAAYRSVNNVFPLTEEEFIEQTRCKF